MAISPSQDDVMTALQAFLTDRLPLNSVVVQGIVNRVAEPSAPNFVVTSLIRATRLSTNVDEPDDVVFTGSIANETASFTGSIAPNVPDPGSAPVMPFGVMTVTAVSTGEIVDGAAVTGAGVLGSTFVTSQIDGTPGGQGRYAVSLSQNVMSGALGASYGLMTVTAVTKGVIQDSANVYGVGIAIPTVIQALGTGTGGTGTYVVAPAQVISAETLSAGGKTIRQNSTFTVQMDFHSADPATAADMAMTISTAFRDPYATSFFYDLSAGTIAPLYADDPRLAPFQNENQLFEFRWTLEANLQVNQTIRVPAQYADLAKVVVINVDATYPP